MRSGTMHAKITADHLERTALVYVRQSTPGQVRDHAESRRRQYALVDVARDLGFRRVETIDEDLGISGSGFAERPGFQRLLTTVGSGAAGAVLALEASRLARNDRDWSQLVEVGAIAKVVLIDHDGIYDPRLVNDRLLERARAGRALRSGSEATRGWVERRSERSTPAAQPAGQRAA